jgi:hypothetical protein
MFTMNSDESAGNPEAMMRERYFPILLLLALCPCPFAQTLPDAPSAIRSIHTDPMEPAPIQSRLIAAASHSIEPRGPRKLLALAGAVAFEATANHYDISETERGLKAGVAVEDYTWLVGSRPGAGQLYTRDLLTVGIVLTPIVAAYMSRKMEFFYAGLSGPVVLGCKHISGGNRWKALLAGHQPTGSELGT